MKRFILLFATTALSCFALACPRLPVIERLHEPVPVRGWNSDTLHLADGRSIHLPSIRELPSSSQFLSRLTSRGVEVTTDGRVFGQLEIYHWCGNDLIGHHVARVEVSQMLIYFGEASPSDSDCSTDGTWTTRLNDFTLSRRGLLSSAFFSYQEWLKALPAKCVTGPHNNAMNLTVRPVTRLAVLLPERDSHGCAQGACPSRPAGYRGRYLGLMRL
jgi:hypothetical protein